MSLDRYRREFSYDAWANREVLRHLQRESSPPASCVAALAHVLAAQSVWIARVRGTRSELAVWPHLTLDEIEDLQGTLGEAWDALLAGLSAGDLGRSVTYTNTKGQEWSSRLEDIVTHVLLHGVHHRGQIASHLREAGLTPPTLDYIHAVRSGLLDPRSALPAGTHTGRTPTA